jgi:small subunit ribosomal protein S3Ae
MEEEKKAEKRERKPARDTWRTKGWYEVFAPSMFGGTKIGETPAVDARQLEGRVLESTLGDLIDDFSKSYIKLYFQVKGIEGNRALTKFIGHDVARDYVRSQVRRRVSKIDGIWTITTQDGYKLRLSALVTTLKRIQSSQIEAMRASMKEVIGQRAAKLTFDQFVQEAILGKLSSDVYKVIKKICPVRRVDIQKTKVLGGPT